mgnify:FL=1
MAGRFLCLQIAAEFLKKSTRTGNGSFAQVGEHNPFMGPTCRRNGKEAFRATGNYGDSLAGMAKNVRGLGV